jgi:hypothetical protein
MKTKMIVALACIGVMPVAFGQIVRPAKPANKANPLATPAGTPLAAIQIVTAFKPEEFAISVQSSAQTRPVKYLLSKKVHYVDAMNGKAVDPTKIRPGTRVRLESKSKGSHGVYRRVVVIQPDRA